MSAVDNHEIRLVLLAQHYRAMFESNECGSLPPDPQLKGISRAVINANMYYLIDKGLMDGRVQYQGPHMFPFFSKITAHGMDVIEGIMDKSLQAMRTREAIEISKEHDPGTKFGKFYDLCMRAAPFCDTVASVARAAFVG